MDNELTTATVETTTSTEENNNTGTMSKKEFESFVKNNVVHFLVKYNLGKINVDVGNGYKATVKINKNGEYETEVSFKEII